MYIYMRSVPLYVELSGRMPKSLTCCFEAWAFSFSSQRPSSFRCINEHMAIDIEI